MYGGGTNASRDVYARRGGAYGRGGAYASRGVYAQGGGACGRGGAYASQAFTHKAAELTDAAAHMRAGTFTRGAAELTGAAARMRAGTFTRGAAELTGAAAPMQCEPGRLRAPRILGSPRIASLTKDSSCFGTARLAWILSASPVGCGIPQRLAVRRCHRRHNACGLCDPGLAGLCQSRRSSSGSGALRLSPEWLGLRAVRLITPIGDRPHLSHLTHDRRNSGGNGGRRCVALRSDCQPDGLHRGRALPDRLGVSAQRPG